MRYSQTQVSAFAVVVILLLAATTPSPTGAQEAKNATVLARVDGKPIYQMQVDRAVERAARGRKIEGQALAELQKKALEQLISQQLILGYLAKLDQAASKQDIDLAVARIERQLKQQDLSLAEYLESGRWVDGDDLRNTLAWQIGWNRYLERWLTDENVTKHFERNRRQFDGTKLEVAHIRLKVEPRDDRAAMRAVLDQAESLRKQIVAGKLGFAEAAMQHSASPSAEDGGNIGLIGRQQPQSEPFSAAAFRLKVGDVSPPVVTVHGVHLIRCLKEVPGQNPLQQVRPQVEADARRYLFDWVVKQQRHDARVEYTNGSNTN